MAPRRHARRRSDDDSLQVADAPVADQFAGSTHSSQRMQLRPVLKDRPMTLRRIHQRPAFRDRVAQRFFTIHIFARLHRGN
jgi:hypothetical protein